MIQHTSRATDHYAAQSSRSNIGIFINQKKTIDIPPVRRYCSGQKKRWFKIPIQTESEEREITVGDIENIKVGERHWHGAKANSPMSHITVTTVGSQSKH